MIKEKKKINWNLISILFLSLVTMILGLIFGLKISMSKVHATAIADTNLTINEGQVLKNGNDIAVLNGNTRVEKISIMYANGNSLIISSLETMGLPSLFYSYYTTISANGTVTSENDPWLYMLTLNTNSACITDNSTSVETCYTIVSSGGYTEEQYLAYGQQQYNSGYSDGVAYVQSNPSQYNLYTASQYNSYGTSQYNAGVQYVVNHPSEYNLYTTAQYNDNYTSGQNSVLNSPNTYGLYTQAQYEFNYTSGYSDGVAYVQSNPSQYNLYTPEEYTAYGNTKYNAGVQYVLDHPSEYNLYTTQEYNSYYQEGYQAGISQGENNVTSNPNDYNLYTQTQYDNNSSYSNFIENNIESIWINTPVYDSNLGYYQQHWQKINNTYISITNSTIDLSNIYTSGYTGITDIQIVLKNKFNGYTPLIIGNDSTNISNYQYAHVDLSCYNNTTANNRSNWEVCQVFGSDVQSAGNSLELDYTYLMNGENYFSVLENLGDVYINDYYNLKYNVITIGNYTYSGNTINVLDGHINNINFDLSTFNLDSYNLGYSSGYTSGQLQLQQAKYNEGYNDGYNRATELYENVGGNANTLVGLAGTVLFSPVTMLKQIFNFEFLGINLAGFILSIISLLVVAWLIKRLI